jgi:hypothetical protein
MATDLFDHLAEEQIPEPPDCFDQEFHARLNRTLLTVQIFEMCIRALPWFFQHFGQAVVGAIRFTMTGKYHEATHKLKDQ